MPSFAAALILVVVVFSSLVGIAESETRAEKRREIVLEVKTIDGAAHWTPAKIEVSPGEKVKLVAKHELKGGFDFHGLWIHELNVTKQVDRNKPLPIDIDVPSTLKPGEYKIACHFHTTHKPAILVVKAAK